MSATQSLHYDENGKQRVVGCEFVVIIIIIIIIIINLIIINIQYYYYYSYHYEYYECYYDYRD